MAFYDCYISPVGPVLLTGTEQALTGLSFGEACPVRQEFPLPGVFKLVKDWLDDYFAGRFRPVDFPVEPAGTPFQKLVWNRLREIPPGQTCTYGQIAGEMAQLMAREKMSSQAVGQAVGKNPVAIIIPCHRVVGRGGALTGYAYGLEIKRNLLHHEGWQKESDRDTPR